MLKKTLDLIVLSACIMLMFAGCDKKNNDVNQQHANVQQNEEVDENEQDPSIDIEDNMNNAISDDVSMVKNGVLSQFSSALTVGQALDGWKGHSNSQWKTMQGERGERLVVFTNYYDNMNCSKGYLSSTELPELCEKVENVGLLLAFSISADGSSFQVEDIVEKYNFKDGKSYINDKVDINYYLKVIYKNLPEPAYVIQSYYDNRQ